MTEWILFEPATILAGRIRGGELTCVELISSVLRRIEALNRTSHVFIAVMAERALREARVWDEAPVEIKASAPLLGVPLAVKDLIDVANVPTTGGSRVFFDNIPKEDAAVVASLARAGAITVGKANLHEFAFGATGENTHFGTCSNAYDRTRLACGSSSGSAAAVGLGLAAAALGSDTGGSVRVPAVLNGLLGIKPTYDLVPTTGVVPFSWTLDHVGFITRTVGDAAALLAVFSGDESAVGELARAWGSRPLGGTCLGIPSTLPTDRMDRAVRAEFERALAFLIECGAAVEEVSLPDLATARTVSLTIQMPEALSFHATHLERRGALYGADLRAGLALGQYLLAEHYLRAKRLAVGMRRDLDRIFDRVDAILTPATPIPAPEIGATHAILDGIEEPIGNALTRYTSLFNLTGHPAVTLPSGLHPLGLPIGIQIVGRHFDERRILSLGQLIAEEPAFRIPPPSS